MGSGWYSADGLSLRLPWESPHQCGFFIQMNILFNPSFPFTATTICRGINHVLSNESWAKSELSRHANKSILLRLPGIDMGFKVNAEGIFEANDEGESHALILEWSAKALSDITSGPGNLRENAFKAVKITGDADLAQLCGRLVGQLRWEYEEDLARAIGDVPAHFAVRQAKRIYSAGQLATRDLLENVSEYLVEEKRILLNKREFLVHKSNLTELREAVERMDKRIQLLQQKAK